MAHVIDYVAMKAKRVAKLEARMKELYVEARELGRLGEVNRARQLRLYDELVRLGARVPLGFTDGGKR